MILEFDSDKVWIQESSFSIGFSTGEDDRHYFVMERDDSYIKESLPNMESVYTELDDQCWGENGGVDRVILNRNQLTIYFHSPRATRIGYDGIKITFSLDDSDFQELVSVLQNIMRGYENKLNFIA